MGSKREESIARKLGLCSWRHFMAAFNVHVDPNPMTTNSSAEAKWGESGGRDSINPWDSWGHVTEKEEKSLLRIICLQIYIFIYEIFHEGVKSSNYLRYGVLSVWWAYCQWNIFKPSTQSQKLDMNSISEIYCTSYAITIASAIELMQLIRNSRMLHFYVTLNCAKRAVKTE